MAVRIIQDDCLEVLKELPDESVNCCVTSPPYWGLRDYGVEGQLGLERTPEEYVAKMVSVFREVRRVLCDDGTLWLNLGDSYAGYWGDKYAHKPFGEDRTPDESTPCNKQSPDFKSCGFKPKDLVGIPWMAAFALRADGWYLRQDIIWHKPNPMPESVADRCTKAHEYIFLMSKRKRYYYDAEAIKEDSVTCDIRRPYGSPGANALDKREQPQGQGRPRTAGKWSKEDAQSSGRRIVENVKLARAAGAPHDSPFGTNRNRRSVWTVATTPFPGAHFATFPPKLIEPCILAGCPVGGTVLDPFGGSGTVGMVAENNGRNSILIELNPKYVEMAKRRTAQIGISFN